MRMLVTRKTDGADEHETGDVYGDDVDVDAHGHEYSMQTQEEVSIERLLRVLLPLLLRLKKRRRDSEVYNVGEAPPRMRAIW